MEYEIRRYVDNVLAYVSADERTKARLAEDLTAHIYAAAEREDVGTVLARMGTPEAMAEELTELLYEDKSQVIRELVQTKAQMRHMDHYEYKSRAHIGSIPLVHVHLSRRSNRFRPRVAKGIIAIGDVSIGLISIGGIALGGLCLGGLALGLFVFAGVALGMFALGGVAIGVVAVGGCAVGLYTFGGASIAARVAVGGYASGTVAIGGTAEGVHTISTGGTSFHGSMVAAEEVRQLITTAYPDTPGWLLRLLTMFFR